MVEWCDLFDCYFGSRLSVCGGHDDAVGSFSDHIDYLICRACCQWATPTEAGRVEEKEGDSPTLNLTFLGAEAEDPFVVFSWGTPCVLAAPIVVDDGICIRVRLRCIESRELRLEMMWEETTNQSSHQLYTISRPRVDLPFY